MLFFVPTFVHAAELKTDGELTVWSKYLLQGYARSKDPFSILKGRVSYGHVSAIVESKQSIVGTSKDNYITGVLDYIFFDGLRVGVKSYSLQDVTSKQMTDVHFVANYGSVSCYTYMFTAGPKVNFNRAVYSEFGYTTKPFDKTFVKFSLGFGNRAHLKTNQDGFSLVNTQITATQVVSDKISLVGSMVYNPYENDNFKLNEIQYATGVSIKL